jgi:hypothetical protein
MRKPLIIAMLFLSSAILYNFTFQPDTKNYTIVNKSGVTITSVYISPAGANKWSDNICPSESKIKNNQGFQYGIDVDKDNCNYDIKCTGEDGKDYILKNVNLCSGYVITLTKSETN